MSVGKEVWQADTQEIEAIVAGRHRDAFAFLGLHQVEGTWVLRAFVPNAETLEAFTLSGEPLGHLIPRHGAGFFEGKVSIRQKQPVRYRAKNAGGEWDVFDPYSFGPVLGPMDDYYIGEGTHLRLFDKMGAHEMEFEGIHGTHFAVWAPNALRVSVVGPWNDWDGRRNPMRNRSGIWEVFIPVLGTGTIYKYEIVGPNGQVLPLKADPYARQAELRPNNASVVPDPTPFVWTDHQYMEERVSKDWRRSPMSIYEVHLGSWRRRPDGSFLSYDQLAEQLVPYVADMGYTHIEVLPISEHPYDPSWGYQPTGLFAPTARFGDPAGFARFVNAAHEAGLGVILDWVPAHFPTDDFGLAQFDGTALYEHADPRQGFHPDWNTAIYNLGRKEVSAFLTNNALYWFDQFHIDGLRVDAVASMLYLDYSRLPGEWVPNKHGGNQNLESVAFLQRVNAEVYRQFPGAFMIAEESTSWPGVTAPTYANGLGFGFKWNLGFMNDTLRYMGRSPIHRKFHHNDLTFGMVYAFSENFVLPLSHDEVVHGKGSLLEKMAGDEWQQFANLRAYLAYMWGHPGKKLLFMGQEFAQRNEWAEGKALDWWLLDSPNHEGMRRLVADLNAAYRSLPALHERDNEPEGFAWVVGNDHANSVFAWLRQAPGAEPVLVISNLTPVGRSGYKIGLPKAGRWVERINTDAAWYAGGNTGNQGGVVAKSVSGQHWPAEAEIYLPPLATLFLKYEPE